MDFVFRRLEPPAKVLRASVEEIHRGIEILRLTKGKTTAFEVSGDLAPDFGAADNGELEDRLKAAARHAKKKLHWSSEADTFVAQAADVDTCRWLIDALHGGEPAAPEPAKTAARQRKTKKR